MGACPTRCRSKRVLGNSPEPESADLQESVLVSLHDYPSFGPTELSMHLGDRLTVTSDDGDFMMVKSLTTNRESYIPTNHTAKVTHRWLYSGISRFKAVELLLRPENVDGSFLIRESETQTDCFSLSVLRRSQSHLDTVKHYRISLLPSGRVFISVGLTFPSLQSLVLHYTENADRLCWQLTKPSFIGGLDDLRPTPTVMRRPTINWKDISRSVLLKRKRTESGNSQVSEGLREAITSYLLMTENNNLDWDA